MKRRSFISSIPLIGVVLEAFISAKAVASKQTMVPLLPKTPCLNLDSIWNETWKDVSEENASTCEKERDYKSRVVDGTKR